MTHPLRPLFYELSAEERDAIRVAARRASSPATVLALRSGGKELAAGSEERAQLLQLAVDRGDVAIEVELLAYEQMKDQPNRNFVRFRDAAMTKLGASGKGTPFLRDHRQYDSTAIGGRVVASKTVKVEAGHYQVLQTVRVTEPAAVERALRGLMGAVSIGWEETAPVICTACGSEVFVDCWHWPGAVITREDGTEERAEWEYTGAALIETSEVPIGGVPTASLEGIRAALALRGTNTVELPGGFPGDSPQRLRERAELVNLSGRAPQENESMKTFKEALAAKLGLGATATDDEVLSAVDKRAEIAEAKLAIAEGERVKLAAIVAEHQKVEKKSAEDAFIRSALDTGQIATIDEPGWRRLFALDAEGARADMAKRPAGSSTPVGQPRQSAGGDPTPRTQPLEQIANAALTAGGIKVETALEAARIFGAPDPQKALAASFAVSGGKVA